jgi:hypothetical protein
LASHPGAYLLLAAVAIALVAWVIEGRVGRPVDVIVIAAIPIRRPASPASTAPCAATEVSPRIREGCEEKRAALPHHLRKAGLSEFQIERARQRVLVEADAEQRS